MIQVRFPNAAMERKAIGFLSGRFSFKTVADTHTLVPESALAPMAKEGIIFIVEGRGGYVQLIPTVQYSPVSAAVQCRAADAGGLDSGR